MKNANKLQVSKVQPQNVSYQFQPGVAFNPFQDGGKKVPHASYSAVTSTNVGINS